MTKKEVIETYFSLMKEDMSRYGFKQKKGDLAFIKKTDFGFLKINLQVIDYPNLKEYWVHFRLQVRRDDVQELMNKALNIFPKGHASSTTTNTHFQVLMGKEDFKYVIKSETDLANNVKHFMKFFDSEGIPHFEKYASLKNLASIYKEHGRKSNLYFGPFGWYKYIAVVSFLENQKGFKDFIANLYDQLPSYGVSDANISELKGFVSKELG